MRGLMERLFRSRAIRLALSLVLMAVQQRKRYRAEVPEK